MCVVPNIHLPINMRKRIIIFLIPLVVIFSTFSFSQTKQFQHITSKDGISQSEVYSFLEDSFGYLWFGTVDGLNRYDGYNIKTFHTDRNNPNSITNNTIRCLAEDKWGRIWIGTDDGLSVYDSESEEIYQINLTVFDDKILTVNTILIKAQQLYLGTSEGLFLLKIDTKRLEHIGKTSQFIKLAQGDVNNNVISTYLCRDSSVWLTTSSGLYHLTYREDSEIPTLEEIPELKNRVYDLRNLQEDNHGNLWIVSHDHGFFRFNPTTKKLNHFKTNYLNKTIISNKISALALDRNNNLWIGTHDKGLMYLEKKYLNEDKPNFQIIQNDPLDDRSLNSNLIYSLYVSKSNLLWIGTIASGINIYDPNRKPFNYHKIQNPTYQTLNSTNFVRAVYSDSLENIWIGMHNNGLFMLNRANNKITKSGFDTESIFHITKIDGENIIVCTGKGVSLVKKVNDGIEIIHTLVIGPAFYATNGKDGVFWVAGFGGLRKCKLINQKIVVEQTYNIDSKPKISFNNCRVLFLNKETDELFIGTEGGGLNILQLDENNTPSTNSVFKKGESANSISDNYIRSIIRDSKSNIWVGTYEGLNKITTDTTTRKLIFKTYTKANGLPNNTIQSIVEDDKNRLWIGTNGGLSKFDPSAEIFTPYTINEGIQSNEFSEHAVFKKTDNEIIFGGINGINTFYPNQITSSVISPNTTITDFYLFNKKVSVNVDTNEVASPLKKSMVLTDSIFLNPRQNSFGFEFSAMVYNAPEKIQYAYILEGFDQEWNYTDAKGRRANYTNLPFGDYIFKVKATNNDGLWESQPKQVIINIKTPFYYTTLAMTLYSLLFLIAIIFFTNYTAIRYTTKEKILLENQHNKKVRELEEFRSQFFINISHDLRTPLTLISSPLEVVLQDNELKPEVTTNLNLVQRNVKKLKDMIEELLETRKIEIAKPSPRPQNLEVISFLKKEASLFEHSIRDKGINLTITSDRASINTSFDPSMISKVVSNILSNALKYTNKGVVNIDISTVSSQSVKNLKNSTYQNFVKIDIQDFGNGIDEADLGLIFERFYQGKQSAKGYGIGLSHSRDLVEAHDGIIEVESQKGIGTTFSIYIPSQKNLLDAEPKRPLILVNQQAPQNNLSQSGGVVEEKISSTTPKAKTILLVEDNVDLRNFLGNELRKNYQVIEAVNGKKGLELAKANFLDLIISDIMMPVMDGIEFCKQIKTNIKTSHIPIILLTAKVNKETKYQGLEIGADDYIAKPFEMKFLFLRIINLLESRAQLRKMFKLNASLEPATVTVTSFDEQFLTKLMAEIEKGIPEAEFTITALEKELGMSHSSFYNKIKSLTGQSAKELVLNARMKRAKQILEDTSNIRVSEVAYMVGFSDPKYFSKSFKEYHGKPPSFFLKK